MVPPRLQAEKQVLLWGVEASHILMILGILNVGFPGRSLFGAAFSENMSLLFWPTFGVWLGLTGGTNGTYGEFLWSEILYSLGYNHRGRILPSLFSFQAKIP